MTDSMIAIPDGQKDLFTFYAVLSGPRWEGVWSCSCNRGYWAYWH